MKNNLFNKKCSQDAPALWISKKYLSFRDKDNTMTKVISGKELSIKLKAEMAAQVRTSTIINLISAEWWK